ncbi:MAG: hypothetical protein MUO81_09745 [Thermoplasmata archaeon]|nr:hypothetical protein [Thermoplasmata archaeon]
MVQIWRLQQVAQLLTLALLALNLSLQLYGYIRWRGAFFATPYTGVLFILLVLAAVIWGFAIFWDKRMKMWREQMTVLMERNPYAKERMPSKEIVAYELIWLPLLDKLGKDDPQIEAAANGLRDWIKKLSDQDPELAKDVKEVYDFIRRK